MFEYDMNIKGGSYTENERYAQSVGLYIMASLIFP